MVRIEKIAPNVFHYFGVKQLDERTRRKEQVEARRHLVWIMRILEPLLTFTQLGEAVGYTSHSMAIYHNRTLNDLIACDARYFDRLVWLIEELAILEVIEPEEATLLRQEATMLRSDYLTKHGK